MNSTRLALGVTAINLACNLRVKLGVVNPDGRERLITP
jgi:hypothetical protein